MAYDASIEVLLADASAAWAVADRRKQQAEDYRARAHLAEQLLMHAGIDGPLMREYLARYSTPTPATLPEVINGW